MIVKAVQFISAVVMFPFWLLLYMNKFLYGFTLSYIKALGKVIDGTL